MPGRIPRFRFELDQGCRAALKQVVQSWSDWTGKARSRRGRERCCQIGLTVAKNEQVKTGSCNPPISSSE